MENKIKNPNGIHWKWSYILPIAVFALLQVLYRSSSSLLIHNNDQSKAVKIQHLPAPHFYLVWTTPIETFKPRNMDVIEAYFYHHPDAEISIFASHLNDEMFRHFYDAGYNIKVIPLANLFLENLSLNCPGRQWIQNIEEWKKGPYYYSHVTDYIRFCVLYTFGGIYSDFDAILINPLNEHANFIGKDIAGTDDFCPWCLPGGDYYLAPGVMGTVAGHQLPENALKIGFDSNYNPNIFNQVGPMAVTKSYRKNSSNVHVYDRHVLYPFNYLTSWKLFNATAHAKEKLHRLVRTSKSLHLYGHKTRQLHIENNSILYEANQRFRVTHDKGNFQLKSQDYLGVSKSIEEIEFISILSPMNLNSDFIELQVTISSLHGLVGTMEASKNSIEWKKELKLNAKDASQLNAKLKRIFYQYKPSPHHRDEILVSFKVTNSFNEIQEIESKSIAVYHVASLVTLIVKTVGRLDKVFALTTSCLRHYPELKIIVADDAESISKIPGQRSQFYYMPLDYDVGLSAGRNRMVENVETEYFLTLDDDFTCNEHSEIEHLIHALDTKGDQGQVFDIAAGKNPADEERFKLDFCGLMKIENQTLYLEPGTLGVHQGCDVVEFVPNLFLARTRVIQEQLKWDEDLKLGEHEDFFQRAKSRDIKVLTCPSVSFQHHQVEHWLKRTKYDLMRNRVYEFWKQSLRKHGLVRLVSFGTTMMDLVVPPSISDIRLNAKFADLIELEWDSVASSHHLILSENKSETFDFVNQGQGEGYQGGNSIQLFKLQPDTEYTLMIYAGNRFIYEELGYEFEFKTLSIQKEQSMNLMKNSFFEDGHMHFKASLGSIYHVIPHPENGKFVGRTQIATRSYLSTTPTKTWLYQEFDQEAIQEAMQQLQKTKISKIWLKMSSQLEAAHYMNGMQWKMRLRVILGNGSLDEQVNFDHSSLEWQQGLIELCISVPVSEIEKIVAMGIFEGYRGAVYWDRWFLTLE